MGRLPDLDAATALTVGADGFLIMAARGALVATSTAWNALDHSDIDHRAFEAFDAQPIALDLAFYTTHKSPRWLQALAHFVYSAYFLAESDTLRVTPPASWAC